MIAREDRAEYQRLFCEIFSEDPSFAERMFQTKLDTVFSYRENGEILSFLYAIPFHAVVKGVPRKAIYVYGVGTVPHARKKGYMKQVFSQMEAYYGQSVDFYYLVPASPSLFGLYETIGYQTAFYLDKKMVFPKTDTAFDATPVQEMPEQFHADYLAFVTQFSTAVIRSETDNQLILEDARYFRVGESGFLLAVDRGTAMVREVYLKQAKDFDVFCNYLAKQGFDKAIVSFPGGDIPYAMVKPVHPGICIADFEGAYTNLNFD